MSEIPLSLGELVGLSLLAVASFVLATRFIIPRFRQPRISKRDKVEAIARARSLLDTPGLDEETRHKLSRCIGTLQSENAVRENWSGQVPLHEIINEINDLWSERQD